MSDEMEVDVVVEQQRVKRFKHQSYNETLREVHLPAAHNQARSDDLEENESHFHEALDDWRQLNLSAGFVRFANTAGPMSASMALLLHNWRDIVGLWLQAVASSDEEGLKALFDLLRKLAHDLRTTLSPVYVDVLNTLLGFLPRSISAPVLTILLETFSSVFKYLLLPSIDMEMLEKTWDAVRGALLKSLPEIQRAMAEVWGNVLRRMKNAARDKAVALVASSCDGIDDASAWVLVSACKSVSQTLHTATPSIISPLLTYHLNCSNAEHIMILLRRVLTALVHHVKNAEQYTPVSDLLVKQFSTISRTVDMSSEDDIERLRRILEVVAVPCSVRQGSRLTQTQLMTLFADLSVMQIHPSLHTALLNCYIAILTASETSLWLIPGRKFLLRIWELSSEPNSTCLPLVLSLHGALADLSWGGWRLVALPPLLTATMLPAILDKEPHKVLELLASLKKAKKITASDTDVVWRTKLEKWALERLRQWDAQHEYAATELTHILSLSSFFSPAISHLLVEFIDRTLAMSHDTLEDYRETWTNSAWTLGSCMGVLSSRDASEWAEQVDMRSWIRLSVEKWPWSPEVINGLIELLRASSTRPSPIPFDEVYPKFQTSLLSHSRSLRLGILRLLSSPSIQTPSHTSEVLKRCLQGEEVSLDVQGVRERVLRIGRIGHALRDDDEVGADLCIRWLLAQLRVNLRPLWSPAAGALASLSQRFGNLVWNLLFGELQAVGRGQQGDELPHWMDRVKEREQHAASPWEDERSWRDPSAHKLREIVGRWLDPGYAEAEVIKGQCHDNRLDLASYEHQLLLALGECPALAEKHNRDLIPYFLSLAGPEADSPLPKHKLNAWLTLFAKFSNPKALHSTNDLYVLYSSLLSHPDRTLQSSALSCVLTYKSPCLISHADKLRMLLDETRWRDELTTLGLDEVEKQDREEVVDVVIRILFGLMAERKGHSRGADRRAAVLTALGGCTDEELGLLIDLMLRPMRSSRMDRQDLPFVLRSMTPDINDKQKTGFLTLLGDVMKTLGSRLTSYWPALLGTTIDLIGDAQKRIEGLQQDDQPPEDDDLRGRADEETVTEAPPSRVTRSLRQLGLKRLGDFFRCPVAFDFSAQLPICFSSFISPRLGSLDKENTQAPSALLELFHAWSNDQDYIQFLVHYDARVLPKIYDCLVATNVKLSVISRVFDIVDNILGFSSENASVQEVVVKPHVSLLLSNLTILVQRSKGAASLSTPVGQRQISILSEIAPYASDADQASVLLGLFAPLLRKPARLVSEKVKNHLLSIVANLIPLIPALSDRGNAVYLTTYHLLSQLFQSLRSRQARLSLIASFKRLASIDTSIQQIAGLLTSLNAFSSKRIDEPDFETRLEAFSHLNETLYTSLSCMDWLPLIYSMLYFIQDPDELAIRNNASFSLRHFIDAVGQSPGSDYEATFLRVLYPGIKNGLHSKNEMVRAELLGVLAYAVNKCEHVQILQDMKVLLAGGDEEANFFNNVHHIQMHRRSRALRRLGDYCDEGHIRSSVLADIFVPLVANFISSSVDHHLVNDAILTTGRIAKRLGWGAYYALVQKYIKLSKLKDDSERVYIRALVATLDSFHFPMEDVVEPGDGAESDADENEEIEVPHDGTKVTLPLQIRISDAVNFRLLPALLKHLETYDANTDDNTRIPISVGIVTVAKHLPPATRDIQIMRLLTILSQIFRSKSQETRDLAREALCHIVVILGPAYMTNVFQELRGALLRGPQLHVLAFVTHSLLVHVTSGENAETFHTLDEIVNDVAHISAEVIFGESGRDVQSEDYKTKMKEVRASSSKGLDSFAIIAKHISPPRISGLLLPLRSIMQETETLKVMTIVDEVLKRISSGLNSNTRLTPSELLTLCHTLIMQNAQFLKQMPSERKGAAKSDVIVQTKRQVVTEADHYANNSFRFVAFGLDLFHTALRRNRFNFHDPLILSRLEAMVVAVGNALYSTNAAVLTLGLKCASGLAKCPLRNLDKSLPVIVRQALDIIRQAGSTESEVVQVALKSLAAILRDNAAVQVKEKDLVYLLELLAPDLEETSRQAAVFTILRAIIARKFVVPEIYDMMDKVSEVMVTSQSPQVQELCRGVLLQFLLDYPQGKGRLRNQMTFLARNLSYVHESGRKSVMELLDAVISKFQVNLIREYADLLFVALVMVVANDDSAKCREMAAHLIKNLFVRLDDEKRNAMMSHVHSWASQRSQPQLARVSSQIYGFVIDVLAMAVLPYVPEIMEDLGEALKLGASHLEIADEGVVPKASIEVVQDWRIPYHSLTVFAKLLHTFPEFTLQDERIPWHYVVSHLLYPHAWVRTASSRLLGVLFNAAPVCAPSDTLDERHPLSLRGMQDVARKLCDQLKSPHLDQVLALQVVKNLFFISKCFYLIPVPSPALEDESQGDGVESDADGDEEETNGSRSLPWLFSKLSYQIRSAHIARRNRKSEAVDWTQQPLAALRWFAAIASHMDAADLEKFLIHILSPVYRLMEDDTIRDPKIDDLRALATELQDLLQTKVGTTKFSAAYNKIRQQVLGVRRERKTAKAMQVARDPAAAAKRKLQRNFVKKESRKRKNRTFADQQGKLKRRRDD